MLKKTLIIVAFLVLATLAAIAYFFSDLKEFGNRPAGGISEKQIVSIRPGQSFEAISSRLHDFGIITDPLKFKLLAKINGWDKKLKAGEYELNANMTPNQVLSVIVGGKVRLLRFTVPEGYTVLQVAALAEKEGYGSAKKFIALALDPSVIRQYGIAADSLEGYLFPDTYHIPKNTNEKALITIMVKRFQAVFSEKMKQKAEEAGMAIHEVTTLASIVEKETGTAAERPLIASVFHNRIQRGMRLQSDPTVIYGIADFDGNLTRKHLRTPTPYNTYTIKGLPPGPIANPGLASLLAVLHPAESNYLYFVSKNDRTHQFSTNLKSHNRAVQKYQLRR